MLPQDWWSRPEHKGHGLWEIQSRPWSWMLPHVFQAMSPWRDAHQNAEHWVESISKRKWCLRVHNCPKFEDKFAWPVTGVKWIPGAHDGNSRQQTLRHVSWPKLNIKEVQLIFGLAWSLNWSKISYQNPVSVRLPYLRRDLLLQCRQQLAWVHYRRHSMWKCPTWGNPRFHSRHHSDIFANTLSMHFVREPRICLQNTRPNWSLPENEWISAFQSRAQHKGYLWTKTGPVHLPTWKSIQLMFYLDKEKVLDFRFTLQRDRKLCESQWIFRHGSIWPRWPNRRAWKLPRGQWQESGGWGP